MSPKKGDAEDQKRKSEPKTLVRVYNLILTFDTNSPNHLLEDEVNNIIKSANEILSKEMKDSLPQIFKDSSKESLISISYNKDED